jgi:2-iminobutanoate/2-iminopropanoate deaminase
MAEGDIADLTTRALGNALAVVEAGGSCLADVVKTTVYLTDLSEFGAVNEAYAAFFGEVRPARAVVEVSRLPKDSMVEVEMIAAVRP